VERACERVIEPVRILARWVGGPAVVSILFLIFATITAFGRFHVVDDEGYASYLFARLVWAEPLAGGFYLRVHPFLSAVYAMPAGIGWTTYVLSHVAIASLGIWWIGRSVERMGGSGWAASGLVALSPIYFWAAVNGQSNSDGFVATVLALFLYTGSGRFQRSLAGVFIVAAMFGRYESAPLLVGLLVHAALWRRDQFVLAGAGLAALAYWGGGALYHADILWPLHFPPELMGPESYHISLFEGQRLTVGHLGEVGLRLASVTPFWLLAFAVRWRDVEDTAKWLVALLGVSFLLMIVLPAAGGIFYFPHFARYWIVFLPGMAVAAGMMVHHPAASSRATSWILAALAIVLALLWGGVASLGAIALALPLLLVLPRSIRTRGIVLAVLVPVLLVVSWIGWKTQTPIEERAQVVASILPFLQEQLGPGQTIYTNDHRVGPGLAATNHPGRTRFLVNHEIIIGVLRLTNQHNGQTARVAEALGADLYGTAVWPCRLVSDGPRRGDLLLTSRDERVSAIYPVETWEQESEPIAAFDNLSLRRFNVDRATTESPKIGLASEVWDFPCRQASWNEAALPR
jgi:hypothetical protein